MELEQTAPSPVVLEEIFTILNVLCGEHSLRVIMLVITYVDGTADKSHMSPDAAVYFDAPIVL